MNSRSSLTIASALLALASLNCSGTSNGGAAGSNANANGRSASSSSASSAEFCESYCTRANTCDTTRDVDTCTNRCENDFASLFPKLRADLLSGVETCWQRNDCKRVLESSSALGSCVDEAQESLAPTAAGTAFCEDLDVSWKKCGIALERSKCLRLAKQYNDEALTDASKCLDKACSTIDGCIASVLDLTSSGTSPGTSSSSSGGSSSGGGSSSSGGSSSGGPPAPPPGK
jgi:hypothetical protein